MKSKKTKGGAGSTSPASAGSPRRPPCALMTASAAMHADCAALKKLTEAGMEVVVVQDADFEASLRIVEKVRRSTLRSFRKTANVPVRRSGAAPGENDGH